MKIIVTGAAGFIGMQSCLKLLKSKFTVLGIDNLNNYYDKNLKLNRIKILKKFKKLASSNFENKSRNVMILVDFC